MNLADIIAQAGNGQNLQQLQRQFGLDEAQTRAAMDELMPAIEAGIRRETQQPDMLAGLLGALAGGNHARYVDGDNDGITEDGNGILGHIFGSKDVSRGVAAKAAETSGVGSDILKKMLPVLAAMAMGALAKQFTGGGRGAQAGQQGGGLGDLLGSVLGGGQSSGAGGGLGGLGDLLGSVLGGGSQAGRGAQAGQHGGGLGDLLGSILGGNAAPETREKATRDIGGVLGDLLGGGTQRGNAADQLLSELSRFGKR